MIMSGGTDGEDGPTDAAEIWGTPVTVRVKNPKTASAQVAAVTTGTPVKVLDGSSGLTLPELLEITMAGDGRVMIFNNGLRRSAEPYSSGDELVLPMDAEGRFQRAPGQPYGPTEPVWSYRSADPEEFYSFFISGAERLPNGNTIVAENDMTREFDRQGNLVWKRKMTWAVEVNRY